MVITRGLGLKWIKENYVGNFPFEHYKVLVESEIDSMDTRFHIH